MVVFGMNALDLNLTFRSFRSFVHVRSSRTSLCIDFQNHSEFQTVTAGKYKRTLTPTKKVTKEDAEKTKEDLESVLSLFRNFVKTYRPQLDIDKVATGETWFGTDALEQGLCDEIKPVDDVLMDFMSKGYNVYELEYSPPPSESGLELGRLLPVGKTSTDRDTGLLGSAVRWLVRTIATEIRAELSGIAEDANRSGSTEKRKYMLMDESSDRIRSRNQD
jgi:ClpP class serine protease